MYPEQVGNYFPLPVELIRPIRFQLAYVLTKQNLRFPTRARNQARHELTVKNTPTKHVYMVWYVSSNPTFTIKHTDIKEAFNADRAYSYFRDLSI